MKASSSPKQLSIECCTVCPRGQIVISNLSFYQEYTLEVYLQEGNGPDFPVITVFIYYNGPGHLGTPVF